MKIKEALINLIPFFGFGSLALVLGLTKWWGFYIVFGTVAFALGIGNLVHRNNDPTFGRRLAMLIIMPMFIVFLGIIQRENLQLEETVFYMTYFITAGIFTRVLIHYAIAKVFGPLIFGRGFCGWACWTAAILEWLPIQENTKIPKKYTYLRLPVLLLSLILPYLAIKGGYDFYQNHIYGDPKAVWQPFKYEQLILFLIGNGLYYLTAVILAFVFKKKRAFCKIACPVSLIMKGPSKLALIKIKPSGQKCIGCGKCNRECPMDVDVMSYIKAGEKVLSTECILCRSCLKVCPVQAIA